MEKEYAYTYYKNTHTQCTKMEICLRSTVFTLVRLSSSLLPYLSLCRDEDNSLTNVNTGDK